MPSIPLFSPSYTRRGSFVPSRPVLAKHVIPFSLDPLNNRATKLELRLAQLRNRASAVGEELHFSGRHPGRLFTSDIIPVMSLNRGYFTERGKATSLCRSILAVSKQTGCVSILLLQHAGAVHAGSFR